MKEEKFKIINFIRQLIIHIDNNLDNFPKKDIELKNRIRNNSYDLLELAYKANVTKDDNYKEALLEEIIAKVKIIDFLLNLCYDKQIINNKRYVKFGEKMDDILKYTLGWIKSIKVNGAQLIRLASRGVNANSDNANFGPGMVNEDGGMTNAGTNNMFNSDGNENDDYAAVRPVDSINCGYAIIDCMRDNIETNYVLSQFAIN